MNITNRVLFMGSKQLGLRIVQEMCILAPSVLIGIVTIDDTNDTRSKFTDFQVFAAAHALDLYVARNKTESEQIIDRLKPDLCLVVGWYWLIGDKALASVQHGFIGIHNSLLPQFRGGSPLIWPIIRGEKEVGFSFFSITSGMDDGPIWAQGRVSVDRHDYISTVLENLENKAVEVLRDNYLKILNGTIIPVDQKHEQATYCAQRFPSDGKINWCDTAEEIYNFLRAQSTPYPGAFTYLNGQEMRVWKAKPFKGKYYGSPGQVAKIVSDGVYIICGEDSALILEEIGVLGENKKAVDAIKSIRARLSGAIA